MRQRLLVLLIAVVVLAGGGYAVLRDRGPDGGDRPAAGPFADPATLCRSDVTTRFAVSPAEDAAPDASPEAAAHPWVEGDDIVTTAPGTATTEQNVVIARSDGLPRVVLVVARKESGWSVAATVACLVTGKAPARCPADVVDFHARRYHREEPSALPAAGSSYGQVERRTCIEVGGRGALPRGPVAPITAYGADASKPADAIVVIQDGQPHLYAVS